MEKKLRNDNLKKPLRESIPPDSQEALSECSKSPESLEDGVKSKNL